MARKRRYAGIVALNGIPLVEDDVKVMDVVVGAVVGLVGSAAIKAGLNKFAPSVLTAVPAAAVPVLAGFGSAAALYFAQKDGAKKRATGHAAGAAVSGIVLAALDMLRQYKPLGLDFGDAPVALNLSNYGGLLVNDPRYNGLLVNDPRYGGLLVNDNSQSMNDLASMGMDNDDDYSDLVALNGLGR